MSKKKSKAPTTVKQMRSPCPVANILDILGDKWTLLVIRDLFFGDRTYGEMLRSPEGIPTNILAERLKRLESLDIITRTQYQQHPPRYRYALTEKGRDLGPVMKAMVKWASRYVPGTFTMDEIQSMLKQQSAE